MNIYFALIGENLHTRIHGGELHFPTRSAAQSAPKQVNTTITEAAWNARVNVAYHQLMDDITACTFPPRQRMAFSSESALSSEQVMAVVGTATRRKMRRQMKEQKRKNAKAA